MKLFGFHVELKPSAVAVVTVLTIFVFVGFALVYRDFVYASTLGALQSDTEMAARGEARSLENELQKFSLLPLALSENPDVYGALQTQTINKVQRLNEKLASLANRTGAPYIYVVDEAGVTIASSNFDKKDSFVGRQYEFRPYFQRAMASGAANYFAKGERTGKAGLFLARRINDGHHHLGVIVVKVEFEEITEIWRDANSTTFVVNADNIILFSSDPSLNYSILRPLSDGRRREILETKQFDDEALLLSPITIQPDLMGLDAVGRNIQAAVLDIPELGWRIYRTEQVSPALSAADTQIQLHLLSIGIVVVGLGLFAVWRLTLERQRARTTKLLKTEVSRQTKELSEANKQLGDEIKQREQINERFRNAREELAQANRLGSIGAITASVAHEINQPVAAIRAFAENAGKLLARKDDERALENMTSIVELTGRIGAITTELRRYARRGTQAIGPISIPDVVEGAELLIGERINAAGVELKIINEIKKTPKVKAGRVRLEQVLVNVLQNGMEAVKEAPAGKIEMRITDEESHVGITISDNGPGIDENISSEIFTPFFTKKPEGLGIGLGIAKDIMKEFGGSIELTTSDLGGAAFKILLQKI